MPRNVLVCLKTAAEQLGARSEHPAPQHPLGGSLGPEDEWLSPCPHPAVCWDGLALAEATKSHQGKRS